CEAAVRVAGGGTTPALRPPRHLGFAQLNIELAVVDIDLDEVAVPKCGDRSTPRGLGCHMADHEPVGRPGEAAVGNERDRITQAFPDQGAGHAEHLAHPGAADGALVANHDNVARLDLPGAHRLKRRLLAVEDARRTTMEEPLMAGELYHAAFGCQTATNERQAASRLERLRQLGDHFLARRFNGTL